MQNDLLAFLKQEPIATFVKKFEAATKHKVVGEIELAKGNVLPYFDRYFVECLCVKLTQLTALEERTKKYMDIWLKELRGTGLNEVEKEWP